MEPLLEIQSFEFSATLLSNYQLRTVSGDESAVQEVQALLDSQGPPWTFAGDADAYGAYAIQAFLEDLLPYLFVEVVVRYPDLNPDVEY